MAKSECFIGIDVSKGTLDVAVIPDGKDLSFTNDADGIRALCNKLKRMHPSLIVLEATGGLQIPAVAAIGLAKLPIGFHLYNKLPQCWGNSLEGYEIRIRFITNIKL